MGLKGTCSHTYTSSKKVNQTWWNVNDKCMAVYTTTCAWFHVWTCPWPQVINKSKHGDISTGISEVLVLYSSINLSIWQSLASRNSILWKPRYLCMINERSKRPNEYESAFACKRASFPWSNWNDSMLVVSSSALKLLRNSKTLEHSLDSKKHKIWHA